MALESQIEYVLTQQYGILTIWLCSYCINKQCTKKEYSGRFPGAATRPSIRE